MTQLGAVTERVAFDFDAAQRFTARLRATAGELDTELGARTAAAGRALEEWRGVFADRFRAQMDYFGTGARTFADSMRRTAARIDQAAELARQEQARRDRAQAWVDEQNAMNGLEKVLDAVGDFFTGDDAPPESPPIEPPRLDVPETFTVTYVEPAGGTTTVSSARPDDLEAFAASAGPADDGLRTARSLLGADEAAFVAGSPWVTFSADALLAAFGRWIEENANTTRRVAQVAAAFRSAGSDGSLALPDAAIAASLRAAGLDGGPAAVTFTDPAVLGMAPTSGYANDPVNTALGNMIEVEADLVFGGVLGGLSFVRTYNSRGEDGAGFGPRWSSWASTALVERADGAAFTGPDGQRATFPRSGAGFGPVAGVHALVERNGPDGLALAWFGGRRWEFDAAGRPVRTSAGPGTAVTFRHDGEGRLVRLDHERGRGVAVRWEGDRIVALAADDGRTAGYRYVDGDLVEADTASGRRHYAYEDAGLLGSVTDADGVVELVNTYDEHGRVRTQLSPFGRTTTFRYLPGQVTVTADDTGGPQDTYVHDRAGRLIAAVDGHGATLRKTYDDRGNPVLVVDRLGAATVQEWDDRCRLVRRTLPTGAAFSFSYDDADRVVAVAASTGARTTYRYSGAERTPSEVVDPEGGVTRLVVEGGLVRRVTDPDGVVLRLRHDDGGHLVAVEDADGHTARFERDAAGRPTAAITPSGRRTTFAYDARGLLTARTGPDGAVWRHEHSPAGRPVATIDPTGARTELRYGPHGEVAEAVDPLGAVTAWQHDVFGNVLAVTGPDGAKWEYGYDALSRLVAATDPAGASWLREYDAEGHLVGSIDPTGVRYGATVDRAGRVTALTDGVTGSAFAYDELGRATAHVRPDGTALRATHDRCGRRVTETAPDGGVTRYAYTAAGRLRTVTAPSGRTETITYDRCGRPIARLDAAGGRWEQRHDADGTVIARTAPDGSTATFTHDAAGRIVRRTVPGAGTTTYAYDAAGRVVAVTDRSSGRRTFTHDAAGRLTAAVDALGHTTSYAYDVRGNLVRVTDPLGGVTSRRYDAVGRLVAETDPLGRTTTFAHDAAGHLIERVDGTGARVRWRHDRSGRVASVRADGTAITVERDALGRPVALDEAGRPRVALRWDDAGRLVERRSGDLGLRWSYDEDGLRRAVGYPDGTATTSTRDAAGRTVALDHPLLGRITLERDAVGRLVGMRGAGAAQTWRYAGGELVEHAVGPRATELLRDGDGRLVAVRRDGREERYAHDAAGQLVGAGDRTFAYDANGRLARETGARDVAYAYDAAGQLVSAGATRFAYDGAGRRTRESGPGGERAYGWDALGRPAMIGDTPTVVDALGELTRVGDTPVLWDSADPLAPLAWVGGAAVVGDGRPWAAVDASDPGGVQWLGGDHDADVWGAAGPGLQLDPDGELTVDGLTWLRNRAYDPATRAFLTPDPLPAVPGTAYAANPYHYAGNDPVGHADPLGLRPMTDADLRAYRDGLDGGMFGAVSDWWSDNWEYVAAGAAIVGGVALLATGVGGPAGIALLAASGALLAGGTSVAMQKYEKGEVDWGEAGQAALVGAAAGAVGGGAAAAVGRLPAFTGQGLVRGLAGSLSEGTLTRGLTGGNPLDPKGLATDLLLGGVAGVPGGRLGARSTPPEATPEIWYRGMSRVELEKVRALGGLDVRRGESFVTQDRWYIEGLAARHPDWYEEIVEFRMQPGTREALAASGVRDGSRRAAGEYPDLPLVQKNQTDKVFVKGEGDALNFGLRPDSVHIFNDRILDFTS